MPIPVKTLSHAHEDKGCQYANLKEINNEVWQNIVTTVTDAVTNDCNSNDDSTKKTVTFSEYLLRSILSITPDQQQELVDDLITEEITNTKPIRIKPGPDVTTDCRIQKGGIIPFGLCMTGLSSKGEQFSLLDSGEA